MLLPCRSRFNFLLILLVSESDFQHGGAFVSTFKIYKKKKRKNFSQHLSTSFLGTKRCLFILPAFGSVLPGSSELIEYSCGTFRTSSPPPANLVPNSRRRI